MVYPRNTWLGAQRTVCFRTRCVIVMHWILGNTHCFLISFYSKLEVELDMAFFFSSIKNISLYFCNLSAFWLLRAGTLFALQRLRWGFHCVCFIVCHLLINVRWKTKISGWDMLKSLPVCQYGNFILTFLPFIFHVKATKLLFYIKKNGELKVYFKFNAWFQFISVRWQLVPSCGLTDCHFIKASGFNKSSFLM